jgi:hypothetical protein
LRVVACRKKEKRKKERKKVRKKERKKKHKIPSIPSIRER